MFFLSLLLFWLPVLGPFTAGLIGGRKTGGIFNAILAVLAPSFVIGVLLFALATVVTHLPLIGLVAGIGGTVIALSHVGPMLVGAVLGGAIAER